MDNQGIDLVKYGALWQKVDNYEAKFDEMSKKIDKMEASIEELVAMANRSRGGFWVGMGFVSAISSFVGFIAHWLGNR
jgi:hypothetical protein